MSLLEWIAERFNPGPVGTVRQGISKERWQPQGKFLVWLLTIIGVGLFVFALMSILQSEYVWQWLLAFIGYLLLAFWLSPQPDQSNMGWLGGLVNNPFRISDNVNRMLFWFALFLLPGKLILYATQTIINTIRVFR